MISNNGKGMTIVRPEPFEKIIFYDEVDRIERIFAKLALVAVGENRGRQAAAARLLRMNSTTFNSKLKQWGWQRQQGTSFEIPEGQIEVQGDFPVEGLDFWAATRAAADALIGWALNESRGSQTRAAKLLALKTTTLNSRIHSHGLEEQTSTEYALQSFPRAEQAIEEQVEEEFLLMSPEDRLKSEWQHFLAGEFSFSLDVARYKANLLNWALCEAYGDTKAAARLLRVTPNVFLYHLRLAPPELLSFFFENGGT